MADIYRAFQFLNESFQLDLSPDQLHRAERQLKLKMANANGFKAEVRNPDDWEYFGYLVPRNKNKSPQFPPEKFSVDTEESP